MVDASSFFALPLLIRERHTDPSPSQHTNVKDYDERRGLWISLSDIAVKDRLVAVDHTVPREVVGGVGLPPPAPLCQLLLWH